MQDEIFGEDLTVPVQDAGGILIRRIVPHELECSIGLPQHIDGLVRDHQSLMHACQCVSREGRETPETA